MPFDFAQGRLALRKHRHFLGSWLLVEENILNGAMRTSKLWAWRRRTVKLCGGRRKKWPRSWLRHSRNFRRLSRTGGSRRSTKSRLAPGRGSVENLQSVCERGHPVLHAGFVQHPNEGV